MRSLLISTAVAVAVLGAAAPVVAATSATDPSVQAATSVTPVAHHQGHYIDGRVPRYLRGFDDPGYAYHGNINGCAEDLGYGRWESCNH
jgi:hypothetical protein